MSAPAAGSMLSGNLYCERCDVIAFPTGPRHGEGHVAVRFRDYNRGIGITLDGEPVEDMVIEAVADPNGWVISLARDDARCPACGRFRHEVRFGDVRIDRRVVL